MNEFDLAQFLSEAGPVFLFALFIAVLIKGRYIVLARELDKCEQRCDQRIAELKAEKAEYKSLAFKAVGLGERLADVAKEGPL